MLVSKETLLCCNGLHCPQYHWLMCCFLPMVGEEATLRCSQRKEVTFPQPCCASNRRERQSLSSAGGVEGHQRRTRKNEGVEEQGYVSLFLATYATLESFILQRELLSRNCCFSQVTFLTKFILMLNPISYGI